MMDALRSVVRLPCRLLGWTLIVLIRGYQMLISPMIGAHCRFHPTCSEYFIQAIRKYGVLLGSWKGICRILRCHPWHPGGVDPP